MEYEIYHIKKELADKLGIEGISKAGYLTIIDQHTGLDSSNCEFHQKLNEYYNYQPYELESKIINGLRGWLVEKSNN